MTREAIREQTKKFVEEIYACKSADTAYDIRRRMEDFYEKNDVKEEDDFLLQEGIAEAIYMMTPDYNSR